MKVKGCKVIRREVRNLVNSTTVLVRSSFYGWEPSNTDCLEIPYYNSVDNYIESIKKEGFLEVARCG